MALLLDPAVQWDVARVWVACVLALSGQSVLGCSADDSGMVAIDAAPIQIDAALPLNFSRARWDLNPVLPDPAASRTSPDLAITSDGEVLAAFTERVSMGPTVFAVRVAEGGPGFSNGLLLGDGVSTRSRGRLFAASNIHLVAEGNGGASHNDIFYTSRSGATWAPEANLTDAIDPGNLYTDSDARVFETSGGIGVLYLSTLFSPKTVENSGLYFLQFTDANQPGTPTALLDRSQYDCNGYAATSDASAVYILAACREGGNPTELIFLSNRSGSFVSQNVGLGGATGPLSLDIAVGADGTLHMAWNARSQCGGVDCTDVFYSRNLAPPLSVTSGEEDGGFIPQLAVDRFNRVVVVFHRLGAVDDVLWSYAEEGAFVRVQLATPGTADTLEFSVGALEFSTATDRPHMVFVRGGTGGGIAIVHGELVP